MRAVALVLTIALAGACGGGDAPPGAPDASAPADAEPAPPDAEPVPALLPLDGFGAITDDSDVLDDEPVPPGPSRFESEIDFPRPFLADEDADLLTEGGQVMLATGNAGGSSLLSEVFAYELLARCELAPLLATE